MSERPAAALERFVNGVITESAAAGAAAHSRAPSNAAVGERGADVVDDLRQTRM